MTGSVKENYPLRTKEWDYYNPYAYADKRAFRDYYVAELGLDPAWRTPSQHVLFVAKAGARTPTNLLEVERCAAGNRSGELARRCAADLLKVLVGRQVRRRDVWRLHAGVAGPRWAQHADAGPLLRRLPFSILPGLLQL